VPGLVGQVSTAEGEIASQRFGAALDRMRRHPRLSVHSQRGATWRLSHLVLDPQSPGPQAAAETQAMPVVFHGVLHNTQALRAEAGRPSADGSVAGLVAELYRQQGTRFVSRLEGEFSLALIDEALRRVVLATDPIGSYPIYWRADADGFIFGSELSAVLRAAPRASQLNLRAVADYLTTGAVLGDKTLAKGVQLLDPGTVLVYGMDDGRVTLETYSCLESFFQHRWSDHGAYLEAVEAAFSQAVRRAMTATVPVGLSLSGGLDSRAILSAVNGQAPAVRTYTLGVAGCADQIIGERLARVAGTQHRFFELNRSYLRDFLPHMAAIVSLTDGMYLSHGLTEMLAVGFLGQTDIGVLLRGHGGELAKAHLAWPLHTDARVYQLTSLDEFIPYISDRNNLVYMEGDLPLERLLKPEARALSGGGVRESFASALAGTKLSLAECCSYLYLRELTRRFTIPSLELFRTQVEVRLPFLDVSFLKVLLAAPSRWRDNTSIHLRLTRSGIPGLARVRNSNTGAPADAGPLSEFVLDKWRNVLSRLNVWGYRHYHNFGDWMRAGLLESVQAELLTSSAKVQLFIDKETIQELVRQTRTEGANRSYLLEVLLILELWMRENCIEDAA
jgi:asparagine synthase (glutamine-hydrolysing)